MSGFHLDRVTLAAPAARLDDLERFYRALELPATRAEGRLEVRVGAARLCFRAGPGEPFYHFALLVPGDGFEAAHAWLAERTEILPNAKTGGTVFDFSFWDALACYCHDPAGNIVELIAHRGIGSTFDGGADLLGISEIGIVTPDPPALHERLGLQLWSGDLDSLAFVGRKAHTLILCRPGRGWLPTGRPAEQHPVEVVFAGGPSGSVRA